VKGKPFVNDKPIPYTNWTPEQQAVFQRICGDVAQQLDYSL
jgi:hypothetical protein